MINFKNKPDPKNKKHKLAVRLLVSIPPLLTEDGRASGVNVIFGKSDSHIRIESSKIGWESIHIIVGDGIVAKSTYHGIIFEGGDIDEFLLHFICLFED